MLETVDFSEEPLPKEEYKARRDALTERLVVLQQQARAAGVGLVVLFEGWNGAGKGSRISDLMYNLDARATAALGRFTLPCLIFTSPNWVYSMRCTDVVYQPRS